LTLGEWNMVDAGLYYFLSSFVSEDARAPIINLIHKLKRQEPTV
jgi:hypothetical protein